MNSSWAPGARLKIDAQIEQGVLLALGHSGHTGDISREVRTQAAQMLAGALCTAIDAALAAEQYATAKKAHFSFSSDDIRAMEISL